MNFLQIVQAIRRETVDSGSGPSTVVGQSGEANRMVNWCADAYSELQVDRDWLWLQREFTVNTVAGTDAYAYTDCTDTTDATTISRFSKWFDGYDKNEFPYFKSYLTSSGVGSEFYLYPLSWDQFRNLYKFGNQNNSQPVHFSVAPNRKFYIGPKPNDIYTISGTYQMSPQILALDADVPEMPSQYHQLVKYEAMSKYGGSRIAPEAMVRAVSEGGILRSALEREQLPLFTYGNPLV